MNSESTALLNQYEIMLNNYASIVEKTNNQIGLGMNLSSLSVAILSVLIAVIAIFVAVVLWKNSKEQKDKMIQFFSEQDRIIKEKNKNIEKIELKFDKLISEYENKLNDISVEDKENKKQIQQAIDELKKEKISAGAYLVPASGVQCSPLFSAESGIISSFKPLNKNQVCFKCGKVLQYVNSQQGIFLTADNIIHCPYCGALNIAQ